MAEKEPLVSPKYAARLQEFKGVMLAAEILGVDLIEALASARASAKTEEAEAEAAPAQVQNFEAVSDGSGSTESWKFRQTAASIELVRRASEIAGVSSV
eukprot:s1022_g6.t1